jgi:hypothetical protein
MKTILIVLSLLLVSATAFATQCELKIDDRENDYQIALRLVYAVEYNNCNVKESDLDGDVEMLKILDSNRDVKKSLEGHFYKDALEALDAVRKEKKQ